MKPYFGHFSIFLDFNINFLKIDSINLFVAIHQWKEESLSFPTRYGMSMAYFFRNNTSSDNMCVVKKLFLDVFYYFTETIDPIVCKE